MLISTMDKGISSADLYNTIFMVFNHPDPYNTHSCRTTVELPANYSPPDLSAGRFYRLFATPEGNIGTEESFQFVSFVYFRNNTKQNMKALTLFISVLFAVTAYSQSTVNNYKYVLVPDRYDFFRTDNQYGLNTLTRMLLEDKGFTAFMGNAELPPQLAANKCNALKADLVEKKGIFVTSLTLLLKDCQGNIIFKSKEGKSREKEWPAAYSEALREAFASLTYKYDSTTVMQSQQPVATPVPATPTTPTPSTITEATGTLYAQATSNGFQLIDTTPKKVLTLLKTSMQDYFIAEGGASNGIVFRKNGEWFFEYYNNNKLVSQKLDIKF